jgi:hypothetical protein
LTNSTKYAAEKEEANFQTKVEQDVWEAAMGAAQLKKWLKGE